MKKEIPPGFFYVVIALLVIGAGWALYYYSEAPFSRPGSEAPGFPTSTRGACAPQTACVAISLIFKAL